MTNCAFSSSYYCVITSLSRFYLQIIQDIFYTPSSDLTSVSSTPKSLFPEKQNRAQINIGGGVLASAKKKFTCPKCQRACGTVNRLKDHMNLHDGLKPYFCSTCSCAFALEQSYRAHVRRFHTGGTKIKRTQLSCTLCYKRFNTERSLTAHECNRVRAGHRGSYRVRAYSHNSAEKTKTTKV